ncbi:MAG: dipeptide ABC transporter ATP-binding protein [Desulfococcaceae bacterium]
MDVENATLKPILEVKNLVTAFDTEEGRIRAVDDVSFSVPAGGTLGVVGESGCGKSVTALSVMRLLPKPMGQILSGEIRFDGVDIAHLPAEEMFAVRGNRISMIFQEPMTALNPVHRIGKQLREVFRLHFPHMEDAKIRQSALEMLKKVGIPEPEQRLREYPHQISGGMRQRVMIAMALACKPEILIADEPTTALDVTIQAQILTLIKNLQEETGMSVVFITHDLGVIAEISDSVVVMYAGKVAEAAPVTELFRTSRHPYTQGLLSAIPRLETPRKTHLNIIKGIVPSLYDLPEGCRFQNRCPFAQPVCKEQPPLYEVNPGHVSACHFWDELPEFEKPHEISAFRPESKADAGEPGPQAASSSPSSENIALNVSDLKMHFPVHGGIFLRRVATVFAVDGVSFKIRTGRTLGLVGESGCGKTTVGRCIIRLYDPTDGRILFDGRDLCRLDRKALQAVRRDVQMIFQDPFESLNSRKTVAGIVGEPFVIHGIGTPDERRDRVKALLARVGLPENVLTRFPHEFSGGQRQRIGVARALALNPRLIVADEPVSALDVSIQSQILNLLLDLQREMGLTYLFISHDLSVVKHISDHIAVMYLGVIVEFTDADTIYDQPIHPYTRALISAIPVPDPDAKREPQILKGDVPSPVNPPSGCRFRTRCPIAVDRCIHEIPPLRPAPGTRGDDHLVACHRAEYVQSELLKEA